MLFGGKDDDKEDTGSLMDTSINNAVIEYGFPAEFFLDTLCRCDAVGFYNCRDILSTSYLGVGCNMCCLPYESLAVFWCRDMGPLSFSF